MRVLIFHGYLLRGTGSNIYNANLAQALAGLGHEVHLLCQDLEADRLEWVDAVGRWGADGLEVKALREPSSGGIGHRLPARRSAVSCPSTSRTPTRASRRGSSTS